jgi:hypothetical protein
MKFELIPVLDTMIDLYSKPRTTERFKEYLSLLQGEQKGGFQIPLSGFNPMAREHVLEKLYQLKDLDIEGIMAGTLIKLNRKLKDETAKGNSPDQQFKVSFNLIDDVKGAWSNRYITEYDTKFKINGLIKYQFCTPLFWASEEIPINKITSRTFEYCYRSLYWLSHKQPSTLEDHVEQEIHMAKEMGLPSPITKIENKSLLDFYHKHKQEDNYSMIFNFFFGDEASKSLEFPCYGIRKGYFQV